MPYPEMPQVSRPDTNSEPRSFADRAKHALANLVRRSDSRRPARIPVQNGSLVNIRRTIDIPAPCRGDRFTFTIRVINSWTGHGAHHNVLRAIERAEPMYHENIEKRLRPLSRNFEPDDFAAAELCINEELERRPCVYEMWPLYCRSWVRVGPDTALCKHLQKQWTDSSDDEAQHARAKRHIEHLGELRELWGSFLDQMGEARAAQAVRLADKPNLVGEVASEITETKQRTMKELREIVEKAVDDHKRLDLYDFVTEYDSALRDLMRHLDIPAASQNGHKSESV